MKNTRKYKKLDIENYTIKYLSKIKPHEGKSLTERFLDVKNPHPCYLSNIYYKKKLI